MELPGDHTHSRILKSSFEEVGAASGSSQQETTNVGAASGSSQQDTTNESSGSVCPQCYPVLSCYKDAFKSMEHSGTELNKTKKKKDPYPKRSESDFQHYRDITRQNEWLRANMFDSLGNYLYCSHCIKATFKISNDRLAHQRSIKRSECQNPIMEFTKAEAEEKRLNQYTIMPTDIETSFTRWWRGGR